MKDYNGKKVIYIDDNIMMLKIVKRILEKFNFEVDTGENASELFALMKINKYDILILDDMMPEISGTEIMQKLKSEGYLNPIIVLTANNKEEDKQKYLNLGFDDYISKPAHISEFERVFSKFLD